MLLIWAVIWYLVSRLASAVRSRDRELFLGNRRLRASIEERSQHMLQTTHQLKAPFAAIHALTQLLLGEYLRQTPGSSPRYGGKDLRPLPGPGPPDSGNAPTRQPAVARPNPAAEAGGEPGTARG